LRARAQAREKPSNQEGRAKATTGRRGREEGGEGSGPSDFSDEYTDLRLSIRVEGRLLKASRYWLKLMTANGALYLNKAHIISIRPLELTPQGHA
jgi:hypothetical protein